MSAALVAKKNHLPAPANDLDAYIQRVNQIAMLSAAEESALAKHLQDDSDLEAARQLILSHLRFVVHIARSYNGYGLPLADLIQEGNIGLMKAVKRFDPEHGVRLVSFAVHWIRAEIHEFVLRNWRIVKIATTKAQRKLFFNLRGAKKRLGWFSKDEIEAVARDLGVGAEVVLEMESRLSGQDISFDPKPDSSESSSFERESNAPSTYLQDNRSDPAELLEQADWEQQTNQQLNSALATLDERSRDIIRRRWLSDGKSTLQELATKYGVSAERIRQLENNAIKKLKTHCTIAA